jgi:hypothetical protein
VWSSEAGIELRDATPEQVAEHYAQQAYDDELELWQRACQAAKATGSSCHSAQFRLDWDEALRQHERRQGR